MSTLTVTHPLDNRDHSLPHLPEARSSTPSTVLATPGPTPPSSGCPSGLCGRDWGKTAAHVHARLHPANVSFIRITTVRACLLASDTVSLPSTDTPVGLRHSFFRTSPPNESLKPSSPSGLLVWLFPANHNRPGQAIRGPPFQDFGYHYRIISNPDYCMASRLQLHDREDTPSDEGRLHVPCR